VHDVYLTTDLFFFFIFLPSLSREYILLYQVLNWGLELFASLPFSSTEPLSFLKIIALSYPSADKLLLSNGSRQRDF